MSNNDICPPSFKSVQEWLGFRYIVESAVKSRFTPVEDVAKGIVIALRGRELDIPIIESLNTFQVIQGKLALSAEGMLAQVYKKIPGAQCEFITPHAKSHEEATYRVLRPGGEYQTFTFNKADAQRAGLWGRGGWSKYPAAMLRSRCVSAMVRAAFPEALAGNIYTPEEVENFGTGTAPPKGRLEVSTPPGIKTPQRALAPVKEVPEPGAQLDENDYVIPQGKHKGRRLSGMTRIELSTLLGMARKATRSKHSKEIVIKVEAYLRDGGGFVEKPEAKTTVATIESGNGPLPLSQIPGLSSHLKTKPTTLSDDEKLPFEK